MILLAKHDLCTGCMACKQICPKQCIEEKEDFLGNLYPEINFNKCVECGKCMSVCPELHKEALEFQSIKKASAVWSTDPVSRALSASGGVATEFYNSALEQGYWICGVKYTKDFHVIHTLSKERACVSAYKQSKYVYSEMGLIYQEIKAKLRNGEKVLFISLPCKVAGLKQYLGKQYSSLITVDIVCHGTPAYQQLKEHILQLGTKAEKLRFRYENEFVFQLKSDKNKIVYSKCGRQDEYLAAFLEGLNYRPSCYQCFYAKPERISDITICDFWGLGDSIPWEHPYSGAISAVLINSERGMDFFDGCKTLFVEERPVEEAVRGNAQLNAPTAMHPKREMFEQIYRKDGFEKAVRTTLRDVIKQDRRLHYKRNLRSRMRKMAGVLIPRYRR